MVRVKNIYLILIQTNYSFSVKYQPIKDISIGGVIMLNRAQLGADEKEEVCREFDFIFYDDNYFIIL